VNGYLLDTNVLSETRRPRPNANVISFLESKSAESLFVSVVTFAEIRFGIESQPDPARRQELTDWLEHTVRPEFEQRILPITEDVMFRWRLLVEEGRKVGHTFSQPDLIIGATALHFGLVLVTRDVRDFARARLPVLNPWHETP
jgi:hypothetical protein